MIIGGKYNWKGQPERLVYLGRNWSGNGYWHQFAKVDRPTVVWCEVVDSDLHAFEKTPPATAADCYDCFIGAACTHNLPINVRVSADGPEFPDGHDCEGFEGGCERFGCPGGDLCTELVNGEYK